MTQVRRHAIFLSIFMTIVSQLACAGLTLYSVYLAYGENVTYAVFCAIVAFFCSQVFYTLFRLTSYEPEPPPFPGEF